MWLLLYFQLIAPAYAEVNCVSGFYSGHRVRIWDDPPFTNNYHRTAIGLYHTGSALQQDVMTRPDFNDMNKVLRVSCAFASEELDRYDVEVLKREGRV